MISRFLGRECSISEEKVRKQIRSKSFDMRNNREGKKPSVKISLNIKAYKNIAIESADMSVEIRTYYGYICIEQERKLLT